MTDVISITLIWKGWEKQRKVFYMSYALKGVETCYPSVELLALALIVEVRLIEALLLVLFNKAPMKKVLHKLDTRSFSKLVDQA